MNNNSSNEFWLLVDEATDKWSEIEDTFKLEPYLEKILNHVVKMSDKDKYEKYFIELLQQPNRPFEIIQYCMHELKWQSVKEAVMNNLDKSSDPRESSVFQNILDSFDEKWEDQDLYQRYSK